MIHGDAILSAKEIGFLLFVVLPAYNILEKLQSPRLAIGGAIAVHLEPK
jgi:hypothetical protein